MSSLAGIFRSAEENRLRAGWRLLAHGVLMFIFTVLFSLAILLPLLALSAVAALSERILDLQLVRELLNADALSSQLLVLSAVVSFPSFTLATWLARRVFDRRTFRSLGFEHGGHPVKDLLFGFGLPGLLFGLILGVESGLGWVQIDGWLWQQRGPWWSAVVVVGSLGVFALVGFYEELVFRGYYLHNLADGLGRRWAVPLSSIAFAVVHAGNPFSSWISTVGLVAAGLFLGFAAIRTGQLWLPIGLHLGWNFFEGTIFGYPVSGTTPPALLLQRDRGPSLFTGGEFGPEAGLIVLPAMLLGTALIYLYSMRRAPLATP